MRIFEVFYPIFFFEISDVFKAQLEQTRALHQAQLQALHEQRRRERRRRRERLQAKQEKKQRRQQEIDRSAGMQIVQIDANDNVLVQQSKIRSKRAGIYTVNIVEYRITMEGILPKITPYAYHMSLEESYRTKDTHSNVMYYYCTESCCKVQNIESNPKKLDSVDTESHRIFHYHKNFIV